MSVFRISGPDAFSAIERLTKKPSAAPRLAVLRGFYAPSGEIIDKGLVISFPQPNSFTGEDVAEIHCHGSMEVLRTMSRTLLEIGLRQAEPGEFSRRAFNNGLMDLTETEGLADLIDAETRHQRLQALRQMQGALKSIYKDWCERLTDILACIEGEIDFPDEEDVPDVLSHAAYAPLSSLIGDISRVLADSARSEKIRSGIRIVIIGPTNAGKSTLINRLAGRDAVIVSDEAGTTRDVINIWLEISGVSVEIFDTAGIREAQGRIEAEGIKRALALGKSADLRIGIISLSSQHMEDDLHSIDELLQPGDMLLLNKSDLICNYHVIRNSEQKTFVLSAKTGTGYDDFYTGLENTITSRFSLPQNAGLTRERHINCVLRAKNALEAAKDKIVLSPELAGDDVRSALNALKELGGEVNIESVLDRVFSRFCIGK